MLVTCDGACLVDVVPERQAAPLFAHITLAAQCRRSIGPTALHAGGGADLYLVAMDLHLQVVFLPAGQYRHDGVLFIFFTYLDSQVRRPLARHVTQARRAHAILDAAQWMQAPDIVDRVQP
jgi:hypothetical protein